MHIFQRQFQRAFTFNCCGIENINGSLTGTLPSPTWPRLILSTDTMIFRKTCWLCAWICQTETITPPVVVIFDTRTPSRLSTTSTWYCTRIPGLPSPPMSTFCKFSFKYIYLCDITYNNIGLNKLHKRYEHN